MVMGGGGSAQRGACENCRALCRPHPTTRRWTCGLRVEVLAAAERRLKTTRGLKAGARRVERVAVKSKGDRLRAQPYFPGRARDRKRGTLIRRPQPPAVAAGVLGQDHQKMRAKIKGGAVMGWP